MIRAQQAPTVFHRHEAPKPVMTAFASAILAALPGAGVQPEKAGTGAAGGENVLGVFEALLAGLTDAIAGGPAEDGKADPAADALPGAQNNPTLVDPALAAASNVLPFAQLASGLPVTQDENAEAAAATGGAAAKTTAPDVPVVDVSARVAEAAAPVEADPSVAPTVAPAATDATAVQDVSAKTSDAPVAVPKNASAAHPAATPAPSTLASTPVETATVAAAETSAPEAAVELAVDNGRPAPVADAPRPAAAAAAAAVAAASASATAAATAATAQARPVEAPKAPSVAAKIAAAPTPAAPAAAPQAAPDAADAVAVAAAAAAATADAADVSVEAAPAVAPVVVPPRPAPTTGDTRRAAAAGAAAKGEQAATAVSSYLEGLEVAEPTATEAPVAEVDARADGAPDIAPAPIEVAETDEPERQAPAPDVRAAATQAAAQAAEPPAASRMSAETVAKLSADIVRKLEGQSTRFDLQLDPHGLGKVDVSVEIDREGRLTAALSFDSAQSASDLKSRSGELRAALEQAGFDVSDSGLSFDMARQGGDFGGRETGEQSRAWSGRAFQTAQSGLDESDARAALSSRSRAASGGVDIRI